MKFKTGKLTVICLFFGLIVAGCSSGPRYYLKSNLNNLNIGLSKSQMISAYSGGENGKIMPLIIRATKNVNGELIEIGEMPMMSKNTYSKTTYWFLFVDGYLKQWGEPRDWQDVKARYEINYNPSASVNY